MGGAAGDRRKEEQRNREMQNKLNEDKQRMQLEMERASIEAKRKQDELDAKAREQEIELQKRNAVLADLEIKLREQDALQRIEFQKSMGGAAVERARNLNQAEYDQEQTQNALMGNKMYLIGGAIFFIVLMFILFK